MKTHKSTVCNYKHFVDAFVLDELGEFKHRACTFEKLGLRPIHKAHCHFKYILVNSVPNFL